MKEIKYFKDERAPFPLDCNTVVTKVVKIHYCQIAGLGKMDYVVYVDTGLRGGGLKELHKFTETSREVAYKRITALCDQYEAEGFSTQNTTGGFPQPYNNTRESLGL
jgi:hypothetical protein